MKFQVSFALLVAALCSVSYSYATEQPSAKQSSDSITATVSAGDRNKRGLYASPYLPYASPYVASPYIASPYVASPYVASPYVASPYITSYRPYGALSSYATYPYVSRTFASPYAYYP